MAKGTSLAEVYNTDQLLTSACRIIPSRTFLRLLLSLLLALNHQPEPIRVVGKDYNHTINTDGMPDRVVARKPDAKSGATLQSGESLSCRAAVCCIDAGIT